MKTKEIISKPDLLKIGLKKKLPIDFLKKLSDVQASMIWNVPFVMGKQFPVLDEKGELFAYVFPYFRATDKLPNKEEFSRYVAEYKDRIFKEDMDEKFRFTFWKKDDFLKKFRTEFNFLGSIYVSARKENFPILKITHAIHPLYYTRDQAYVKAEKYFKTEAFKLSNIYFFGPVGEYYEFETKDKKILMNPFTLEIIDRHKMMASIKTEKRLPEFKENVEFSWKAIMDSLYEEPIAFPIFSKFIPEYKLIPVFDQTYWCSPTAWTMALGYYDNYVPGRFPKLGYARLIDYWYFNEETQTNIPNLIDKLLDEEVGVGMSDLETTINSTCGYDFDMHHWTAGMPENEFGWLKLKEEIDAGRPCIYDVRHTEDIPEGGQAHVMCAFGYGMFFNQKLIYVLNTWGPTFDDQFMCLPFDQWLGYETSLRRIGHIIPNGGVEGSQVFLQFPMGKEEFRLEEEIPVKWESFGGMIKKVDLLWSKDDGKNWDYIEKDIVTEPGMNTFFWKPKKVYENVRIRIMGYGKLLDSLKVANYKKKDFKFFYLGGDGMKSSFKVIK